MAESGFVIHLRRLLNLALGLLVAKCGEPLMIKIKVNSQFWKISTSTLGAVLLVFIPILMSMIADATKNQILINEYKEQISEKQKHIKKLESEKEFLIENNKLLSLIKEKDFYAYREYNLKKEIGSNITIGHCHPSFCNKVLLVEMDLNSDPAYVYILVISNEQKELIENNYIRTKNKEIQPPRKKADVHTLDDKNNFIIQGIPLVEKYTLGLRTKDVDFDFVIEDNSINNLKLGVFVKEGTNTEDGEKYEVHTGGTLTPLEKLPKELEEMVLNLDW